MKAEVPYGKQYIDREDIKQVSLALMRNKITTGTSVKNLENAIKKKLKSKYSITCSSGTSGIHLSLIAIGVQQGDVIILPVMNFVAAYSMCAIMGAKVFFADVHPLTGQVTPETILSCIRINKLKNIKAIFVMWHGGYPENSNEFYKIKVKYKCYLIEDACHALGAKYLFNNKYEEIGSCKHSDISTFSLHPVKTITAGEGGIVTTNNNSFYKKMILARSHNIKKNKKFHWEYQIRNPGFNYRLSDINCALALSQLKKINKFIEGRKKIFKLYQKEFRPFKNIIRVPEYKDNKPAYHLFIVSINFKKIKLKKNKFLMFLKKNKIMAQYHYVPIYRLGLSIKINKLLFKGAEYYYRNSVSLPIFFKMNTAVQKEVIQKIINYLQKKIKK